MTVETVVNVDRRDFLKPSISSKATYKILHYRLPGWVAYLRFIKVDILTSGTINLPAILASDTPQITIYPPCCYLTCSS